VDEPIKVTKLHRYPLKSARGESLTRAVLASTGFEGDREWLLVHPDGRFLTQRELPRLALLTTRLTSEALWIEAPGLRPLAVATQHGGIPCEVRIWKDTVRALDQGDGVAAELSAWAGVSCRLVRFDPEHRRLSDHTYTGTLDAPNTFSDGYPLLLVNEASLADLNARMARELPMNRFRPNLVVAGLPAWAEDSLGALHCGGIVLRVVKPCTRCRITTIDQANGEPDGEEPLRTLRSFRHDPRLGGFTFGQNVVIVRGVGDTLSVGDSLLRG
jgi:uncharacterized protein YcbX